jgi:curved DNA-binding protein CbpA
VTGPQAGDPFLALGLERRAELPDDDVRAAWRRVAAATHPDRADGGDPAAFAAAATAYTLLRTRSGRGEALADLLAVPGTSARHRRSPLRWHPAALAPGLLLLAVRVRRGRPAMLALRVAVAVAIGAASVLAAGWQPASPAIITGALTWLIRTGRGDLAAPPS